MTDPTQFIVDQTYIHKVLTHEGVLGKGRDFLGNKECSLHLYTDKFKRSYVMQLFDGVDQEFVSNKLTRVTKSVHSYFMPNSTKVCFVSTRKNTKGLFDISVFYDATSIYGYSLEYIIKMKVKNKEKFEQSEIIGFFWQIADFLYLSGIKTGEFLEITPVNIFCKPDQLLGYNFFPNNFGLHFQKTKWERNYHNPSDKFWKGDPSLESAQSAVVFIFGMVLLELCSLQSPTGLYENEKINEKALSKRIEGIKIVNDQMICGIIKKMLKINEKQRMKLDDIFKNEEYLKLRRIQYYKNKAGFFNFKTFEGMVEYDKKVAIGEGLDEKLCLNRGQFKSGVLEGFGLKEENENIINIGTFTENQMTEGTQIHKNKFLRIGKFKNGKCNEGVQLALNIGLLNKDSAQVIGYEGQFENDEPSKGTVYYLNGDQKSL